MTDLLAFRGLFAARAGRFLLALLLSVLALGAGIGLLGVSGWFITAASLAAAAAAFDLFAPSALVRGLSLLRILARYGERLAGHAATLSLLADLRAFVFGRLLPRAGRYEAGLRTGDLVSRLTADIDTLDTVFLSIVAPVGAAILGGAAVATALAILLPAAVPAYGIGFAFLLLALPVAVARLAGRPGEDAVAAGADLRTCVLDGLEGHADLVAFDARALACGKLALPAERVARARLAQAGRTIAGHALGQAAAGLTLVTVLWIGLGALEEGSIGGPMLAGLLFAVLASFEAAAPVLRGVGRYGVAVAAARRVRALVEAAPAVRDPSRPHPLPPLAGLAIEGVRFGHRPGHPVLDGVDLAVAPGERVAILGASGAGKSTLLHLILRLEDVEAGAIRLGGVDVRDAAQADLHRRVAWLGQDAPVFLGTIGENLRIGDPEADDAALFAALAAARLDGFVRTLPQGLETWLGEGGLTLSAGQARRLCLARVLLAPAPILLLDEPTSGLDPETERDFLADLGQATAGRTVILATHAALPPGVFDSVYRLAEGRLAPV